MSAAPSIGSFVFIAHSLGVIAALHAIRATRTSQGAIAWAISLVTMPYLTLVPYLFLGRSKFSGYVDARRVGNRQMRARTRQDDWEAPLAANDRAADALGGRAIRALSTLTSTPFLPGNRVRLLVNGTATFTAIFDAIRAARTYVIVQFFVVRDDALGRELQALLLERAAHGVRVFFLYDGIGSHALPRSYTDALRAGGVDVHAFATRRFVNRFQLNFRNHRKLVVVDGAVAFIGGHNVGVEYLGERPPLSPWRDTHIRVEGPAVARLQFTFLEDWYWATRHLPNLHRSDERLPENMHCQVIAPGPADPQETCSLFFVAAIGAARTRLWITTPYLVPDEAVSAALRLAVLRGVDVRILIPNRPDHRVVFAASTLYAHEMVRAGIRVFRYGPGFLHQKVMLIDDAAAAVGSANLDNRSFRLNFELTLLTVDRQFACDVEAMLNDDFAQSVEVVTAEFRCAGAARRLAMQIARLFAPIL